MRILIIEDNQKLADSISRGLAQEGYAADYVLDGLEGERKILMNHGDYDVLILDLTLPGKGGIAICDSVRANGIMLPILMLTAKDTVEDRVRGLDTGADDYLVKPFAFEELLSRVRALSRRPARAVPPTLRLGTLMLNPSTQEVYIDGQKLHLTLKEFRILEYFMIHPGEVLSRQKIIDHLWDGELDQFSRVMDVHINNVRNKLRVHTHGPTLETIRGIGYRLRV